MRYFVDRRDPLVAQAVAETRCVGKMKRSSRHHSRMDLEIGWFRKSGAEAAKRGFPWTALARVDG